MSKQSPDDLLTTPQASQATGISEPHIRYLIRNGRLPASKVGPVWLIRRGDLKGIEDRPGPGNPNWMRKDT